MYLGPITREGFQWQRGVHFHNDGTVDFNNTVTIKGDLISGGSNSWKFHTPDDKNRTTMYLGPITREGFQWQKGVHFESNGKVKFNNNISVQGKIESKEIKVTNTPTADFVFEEDYNLPKLEFIEKYIKREKHLPAIASASEMKKNGVNVGNFQIQLLQKIEELTIYTIQQEKKLQDIEKYKTEIKALKKQNKTLKLLLERVARLEQKMTRMK